MKTIAVNNGYKIVRDKTRSFAQVIFPVEGQVIPRHGQLVIETRHQLTYERFDDRGTYYVRYRLHNENTYAGGYSRAYRGSDIDPESQFEQLPNQVGEFVVDSVVLTSNYTHAAKATFGSHLTLAFTWAEADRGGVFVESDAHNFSTSR